MSSGSDSSGGKNDSNASSPNQTTYSPSRLDTHSARNALSVSDIALPSPMHLESSTALRGRRGRQARLSQLTISMQSAVMAFSLRVGAPIHVPPAGFRDFRGWLTKLTSTASNDIWDGLIAAIAKEVYCDIDTIHELKEDVIREIIRHVVVRRPEESVKLVSTNAGRQCLRPRSGLTLMVVFEQHLARWESRLPFLVSKYFAGIYSLEGERQQPLLQMATSHAMSAPDYIPPSRPSSVRAYERQRSSLSESQIDIAYSLPTFPSVLEEGSSSSRAALPSFRELDDSLERSHSSPPPRRI